MKGRLFSRLDLFRAMAVLALSAAPAAAQVQAIAAPRHDLRLGFTVAGRVAEVLVQPGERVEAGQPIVRLDDRESRAQIELYTLRAESELEVQSAEAEWKLAQNEEARLRDAFAKAAAGAFEVDRAALQTRRASLAMELARQRRVEAANQLGQARLHQEQFTLSAPLAGRLEQVMVAPGEMVEASRPVLRLVVIDPLRLDAPVPTEQTLALRIGGPAWVRFALPGHDGPVVGRIIQIGDVADAASDTRLVRVEVPNTASFPAGCHAEVAFTPPPQDRSRTEH